MAKANLGTKRVCPETGRKFYDLEKDPIISPYTGKEYPLTFFEGEPEQPAPAPEKAEKPAPESKNEEELETEEIETADDEGAEIISLEDAEEDIEDDDEEIPDIPDVDVDVEDDDDPQDDDTFLEDDDEDDDLSDVIVAPKEGDEET